MSQTAADNPDHLGSARPFAERVNHRADQALH
jgi:hypothetical protein